MTSPAPRRRQRSKSLLTAVALLAAAAVLTVVALVAAQTWLLAVAAVVAVVLGGVAVRILATELLNARREAARDRAGLARSYVRITEQHNDENLEFIATMKNLMAQREAERDQVIAELQEQLGQAHLQVAEAVRARQAESRRANMAEAELRVLQRSLDGAESQAAEAVVRVAELEGEIDALRAELAAWRAERPSNRKHA